MSLAALKKVVPAPMRSAMRSTFLRVRHAGIRHRCNICGAPLRSFLAYGEPVEVDFLCPVCFSKPPHRLAEYYFAQNPRLFVANENLLHVAPEAGLGRVLARRARRFGMRYRSGWIAGEGDQFLDLLDIGAEADSIDLVYCCHVLNCMQEDRAAMREVFRVLRPGGTAILQVPAFYRGTTTLETNGEEDRIACFGDNGIYRSYTNDDYEARLREAGFEVTAFRARDLPGDIVRKLQLKEEVLHVCRKTP